MPTVSTHEYPLRQKPRPTAALSVAGCSAGPLHVRWLPVGCGSVARRAFLGPTRRCLQVLEGLSVALDAKVAKADVVEVPPPARSALLGRARARARAHRAQIVEAKHHMSDAATRDLRVLLQTELANRPLRSRPALPWPRPTSAPGLRCCHICTGTAFAFSEHSPPGAQS